MEDKINSLSEEIEKNNIKACFGIPGSGLTLSLIDVLEKKGIPFYLNQFEGSGSLMASTFGKVNNSVGLSLSIKGPGLANSVPGIAASWFESFPLIHLTESHNYASSFSFSHKRIEFIPVFFLSGISHSWRLIATVLCQASNQSQFRATNLGQWEFG